ncbi:MAG: DUF4129 domain-containing protein [Variovorax sp.]
MLAQMLALVFVCTASGPAAAAESSLTGKPVPGPAAADGPPTEQQVRAAADNVRADPDLPGTKTERSLRFKSRGEAQSNPPTWAWLRDLRQALVSGAQALMWLLGALAVVWIAVRIHRWVRLRADGGRRPRGALPSHVGTLDIRPQSLPGDIGAVAAALWQRGEMRAALSLLYRGALSRLVHQFAVPIRAASTEGDCLRLAACLAPALAAMTLAGDAAPHALNGGHGADAGQARHSVSRAHEVRAAQEAEARQAFFARLIAAWQLVAYGGRRPDTAEVLALCQGFDRHLPASPTSSASPTRNPKAEAGSAPGASAPKAEAGSAPGASA